MLLVTRFGESTLEQNGIDVKGVVCNFVGRKPIMPTSIMVTTTMNINLANREKMQTINSILKRIIDNAINEDVLRLYGYMVRKLKGLLTSTVILT
jgi:hypothetical protein